MEQLAAKTISKPYQLTSKLQELLFISKLFPRVFNQEPEFNFVTSNFAAHADYLLLTEAS